MPVAPSSPLPRDPTGLLRWAPRDAFPRAVSEDLRARADDHDHRVHLYDARTPEPEKIKPPVMFVLAGTGPQAVWRGKYVEGTTTSVEGLARVQGTWLPVRVTARDPGRLVLARVGSRSRPATALVRKPASATRTRCGSSRTAIIGLSSQPSPRPCRSRRSCTVASSASTLRCYTPA